MLDRASNLMAFPLPPTSYHAHSSVDRNYTRMAKPPPRSNSIPIQLRCVVVNLFTLEQSAHQIQQSAHQIQQSAHQIQQSAQQNFSRETGLPTYVMHHTKSSVEPQLSTTLLQHPHRPRRRADTHRVQGYHPAAPLDIRQAPDAESSSSSSGGNNSRSRYPITFKWPTNAELRGLVPPSDSSSIPIRTTAKVSIHQQRPPISTAKPTGDSSHSNPNHLPSAPPVEQSPSQTLSAQPSALSTVTSSESSGPQDNPPTSKTSTSPDRTTTSQQRTPSNLQAEPSPASAPPTAETDEAQELETLHMDDLRTETKAVHHHPTLDRKPSITDRPRPIARGRSLSFSNRAAESDHLTTMKRDCATPVKLPRHHCRGLPHTTTTSSPYSSVGKSSADQCYLFASCTTAEPDQVPTSNAHCSIAITTPKRRTRTALLPPARVYHRSLRGRSQSLPGRHITPSDQPDPSESTIPHTTDKSLPPDGEPLEHLSHLSNFLGDSHGGHGGLLGRQIFHPNSCAARLSAASGRSVFSTFARLDWDREPPQDLQLHLPDEKPQQLSVDTQVKPFFTSKARSEASSNNSPTCHPSPPAATRRVRKLRKSNSLLKPAASRGHATDEGTLDRSDDRKHRATPVTTTTMPTKPTGASLRRATSTTTKHSKSSCFYGGSTRPTTATTTCRSEKSSLDPPLFVVVTPDGGKGKIRLRNLFNLPSHLHKLRCLLVVRSAECLPLITTNTSATPPSHHHHPQQERQQQRNHHHHHPLQQPQQQHKHRQQKSAFINSVFEPNNTHSIF